MSSKNVCYTCKKQYDWKYELQAGHYIHNQSSIFFDEMNVHAQCVSCNSFKGGMTYEHGIFIDRTYGDGSAALLYELSMGKMKRGIDDYLEIEDKYLQKLNELNQVK